MTEQAETNNTTLDFSPDAKQALVALIKSVPVNRRVIPLLKQLTQQGAGTLTIETDVAKNLLQATSAVLDSGVSGQVLLGLASAEETLLAAIGPVPPLPKQAPENRKQRRAACKRVP